MIEPAEQPSNVFTFRSRELTSEDVANIEASRESARSVKADYAFEMTEFCLDHLKQMFASFGIDWDSRKMDPRDLVMIEQSIQAAAFRYYNMVHPMHQVTDQAIKINDEEDSDEEESSEEEELLEQLDEDAVEELMAATSNETSI